MFEIWFNLSVFYFSDRGLLVWEEFFDFGESCLAVLVCLVCLVYLVKLVES